jgi:hypothetical protein
MTAKGIAVFNTYKRVFKNLILYKPGDLVHTRTLTIGGGRTMNADESSRKAYENMGFYRFDAHGEAFPYRGYGRRGPDGTRSPYEILPIMQDEMVTNPAWGTTDRDFTRYLQLEGEPKYLYNRGPIRNNFRRVWKADEDPKGYKIIVFSSCAAVEGAQTAVGAARVVEIASLQRQRILESWAMGLTSLSGGEETAREQGAAGAGLARGAAGAAVAEDPLAAKLTLSLRYMDREAFLPPTAGAIEFFSKEDSDLGAALVAGGRRKKRHHAVTRRRR